LYLEPESGLPLFTELPIRGEPVEKAVVGPVGGPKEARNKAKRLQKTESLAPEQGAEESAKEFSNWLVPSRKLARAIGNDEAPGLFTEGFYRHSILSTSPDATNHHLNLLAQRFIFW
jgi:hypothetical protein